MIRRIALLVAVVLLLAFGSWRQMDAPLEVRCGTVTGGTTATAKGVTIAREAGEWLHEVATNPEPYRSEANIRRTLDGMFNQVLWYWVTAGFKSARGEKIDPQILKLEQDAQKAASAAEDSCTPCPGADIGTDQDGASETVTASLGSSDVTPAQGDIVRTIVAVGKAEGVPQRGWVAATAAGLQESGLRNLTYGHSSSVGVWQLIDDHGTVAQRTNVEFSARWFFRQLKAVRGWERLSINDAAQAVERSAHPNLYGRHEAKARALVQSFSDEPPAPDATPDTPPPGGLPEGQCITAAQEADGTEMVAVAGARKITDMTSGTTYQVPIPAGPRGVAINFALDQVEDGDWYEWASRGPDTWDCSSLTSAAWRKAGVSLIPQSQQMRNTIPLTSNPQPGDILWHPGHVQMFAGKINGESIIIEAPRTGSRMRIRPQWMKVDAALDPTKMDGAPA